MNIYKWLWSKIGGRPWTFIIQDTWHKLEGIWIICLVACGAVACHYLGLKYVLIGLGIFVIGYIFGHLFWGKEYIPDQQGK
ncbi:unnamed protein product [marine sediment metagenome]|uniref:Uncharacterized protein n=1 Tax=marine sediment metagenome TaxID=412755 RepID=X0ZLP4_9ZZZZ